MLYLLPLGLLMLGSLCKLPARAQDAGGAPEEVHFGAGSCAAQACHGGGAGSDETWRRAYKLWATQDKHAGAYDILTNELGRRIGERLGIEPTKAAECLVCHGTTGVATAETFDPHDGVSCEQCHGGAKAWLGPHAAPGWKDKSPSEKELLGFRDLSTAAKRSASCVRCHVAGAGGEITHAIMAAGHPPLVFDAAKFVHDMPPHWDDANDLSVATWVHGQRANAAAMLERIAAAEPGKVPDFALFDCYSCHHPIYTGSVYETAATPGRPGDLAYETSSLKVFLTAIRYPEDAEFAPALAATVRPELPGDPAAVARGLAERLPTLPSELNARAEARAWLENLDAYLARIAAGEERASRFVMQQLAFAAHSLAASRDGAAFTEAFAALDEALDPRRPYDARRCAELARAAIAAGR